MKKLLSLVACLLLITLLVIGCEKKSNNEDDNLIKITFDYSEYTDVQWDEKFSDAIILESGEKIGELPSPSKTGYSFAGWFTKNGKRVTDSTRFDDDTIIYAKFHLYHLCVYVRDDTISTDATCTQEGFIVEKCTCGKQTTRLIPKLAHEYEEKRTEPTCTIAGKVEQVCKNCQAIDINATTTINALGHDYQPDVANNKLPTCTSEGYDALKCSRCADPRRANTIAALGHTWVDDVRWAGDKKPDCQTAASGWSYQYCSVCNEENTAHASAQIIYAVGEYPCDIARDDAHCIETVAVSCQNDGYTIWACSICGKIDKRIDKEKVACDFSRPGVVTVAETCYNDRTELRTCAFAEHTINNTKEMDIPSTRLPHTPNVANADSTTDKYCVVCAEHFLGAGVIPKADDFADSTVCPNANDFNCAACPNEGKVHLFEPAKKQD